MRSVECPDWHDPLVRRPSLSARAARMLSAIVTTQLLEVLASRSDIAPALAEMLRNRVAARLQPDPLPVSQPADTTAEEALVRARDMAARGKLSEDIVLEAVRHGEARYAAALLAVAAGKPVSVVDRAASLRSAKGVISLVWNAGFTMRLAVALQGLLAHLPPDAALGSGVGGSFPLTIEEMRWQLEFLSRREH